MNRSSLCVVLGLLGFGYSGLPASGADPHDSGPVLKVMRAEISAKPSRVLIAVEDALTMNEQAACEIVKEAIESTRADETLVGEIVFTALNHSPAMSAVIVECSVATSPKAVAEIKKAMEKALGAKSSSVVADLTEGSGKESPESATGKQSVGSGKELTGKGIATAPISEEKESFDFFSVGVGGIYLTTPSSSYRRCAPSGPCCNGDLTPACLRP